MHTGALMAVRQFLGQYLLYAKGWQRGLIAVGVIVGGALLLGLARAFTRPVPRAVVPEGERERLAREIAELGDEPDSDNAVKVKPMTAIGFPKILNEQVLWTGDSRT